MKVEINITVSEDKICKSLSIDKEDHPISKEQRQNILLNIKNALLSVVEECENINQ